MQEITNEIIAMIIFMVIIILSNRVEDKMDIRQVDRNRRYYPNDGWRTTLPELQGFNSNKLSEIEGYLTKNFPSYQSLMIIKNGYLVYELCNKKPYENFSSLIYRSIMSTAVQLSKKSKESLVEEHGECHNLRSATKSIMSILLGIALDKKYISSIDEKIYRLLPDYNFEKNTLKKEITIEHLITMKSGLASIEKGANALKFIFCNGDWVKHILDLPLESRPGEKFEYNSANTHLLSAIISKATGMSTYNFANKYLFQPLGIRNVYWEKDKKGINFGGGNLFMTTQDLAKIGYLYLNNGIWDGEIIISKSWIEESLKSRYKWIYGFHYGYLWYTRTEKSEESGKEVITYSASGYGGQKVFVIPELDIVMAATSKASFTGDSSYFLDNIISKYILPSIDLKTIIL